MIAGEHAFWQAYADDDTQTMCSNALGYTSSGNIVALSSDPNCQSAFNGGSAAGTSITFGQPMIYQGVLALVPVTGTACGWESPTPPSCGQIPDLSSYMPVSNSETDVADAIKTVIGSWNTGESGWTPDLLVNLKGTWVPIIPIGDPNASNQSDPGDSSTGSSNTGSTEPWTDKDWNETCPSGGCGGVSGLPPVLDGGGLKLSPDN